MIFSCFVKKNLRLVACKGNSQPFSFISIEYHIHFRLEHLHMLPVLELPMFLLVLPTQGLLVSEGLGLSGVLASDLPKDLEVGEDEHVVKGQFVCHELVLHKDNDKNGVDLKEKFLKK